MALTPETAVPIQNLREELSIFHDMKSPNSWTGHVRGSPAKWNREDGDVILRALFDAKENPVERPFDDRKLQRLPTGLDTDIGVVAVPEADDKEAAPLPVQQLEAEVSKHTEIQYLLLKLGSDMGFDVWVARNDASREYGGQKFSERFRLLGRLPLQFNEATTKTIELIDVLWLKSNTIVAAFEIESTTSIYSGLLRMSDLTAMQPNLNIPLYLVAPDERREKVFVEVNRPTFSRLSPRLVDVVRYISFSALTEQLRAAAPFIKYLKPAFVEEMSEVCELEER